MWLSLFLILLIAAVTYFIAIQGLFSALIMCVFTVLCCAFAFGIHEYVALEYLIQWKPDFAIPLSLVLSFAVPLIILRSAADALLRRSCLIASIFDRVGGAVFGFLSAMIIVGVLAVAMQALPFGESFLGFRRVDPSAEKFTADSENELWLTPDRFAVGLALTMSNGIFSGQRAWQQDHPDFVQEVGWSQTAPREVRCFVPRSAVTFVSAIEERYVHAVKRGAAEDPNRPKDAASAEVAKPGRKFVAVRLKPGGDAQDTDGKQRFCPYQVRLVGQDSRGTVQQYHPFAVMDSEGATKGRYVREISDPKGAKPAATGLYAPDREGNVNVLFDLPESFAQDVLKSPKGREPIFVEYKMGARAEIRQAAPPPVEPPPDAGPGDKTKSADAQPGAPRNPTGRTHGANVDDAKFTNELPQLLTKYNTVGDAEIQNGVMHSGYINANLDDQGPGPGQAVKQFQVPQGKALLRMDMVNVKAGSLLGKAKSFAVKTVENYIITTDGGGQYKICGQIAVANVGNERMIEVQYFPEAAGTVGGVRPFERIKDSHMTGSGYELYFLFLIDSGRKVVTFKTTGGAGGADLSDMNLVAP